MPRRPPPVTARACGAAATGLDSSPLLCSYPLGHAGPHSWWELRQLVALTHHEDNVIEDLCQDILAGRYDYRLEWILTAAHERKRRLRGKDLPPFLRVEDDDA